MRHKRKVLSKRVQMAKRGLPFAKILRRDGGAVTDVLAPGSQGKQYHVKLNRRGAVLTTECALHTHLGDGDWCEGNRFRSVCYHSIGGVEIAMREAGLRGSWCADEDAAKTQARLHKGEVIVVQSEAASSNTEADYAIPLYLVVWSAKRDSDA